MDQKVSGDHRQGGQEDSRSGDSDDLGGQEDLRLAYMKDLGDFRQGAQEAGHRSMARGVPGDQEGKTS